MKTLFLHLGFHKTATTSFQKTCADNQEVLLEHGIYYPVFTSAQVESKDFFNHSQPLHNIFCKNSEHYHLNIRKGIKDFTSFRKELKEQLIQCLSSSDHVILSGEDISTWQVSELNSLASLIESYGFTIKPIVMVRSPYEFHCSAKQQLIKSGNPIALNGFISQINKIKNIKQVFPNALFIPFKKACKHVAGPTAYLLDLMGIPYDGITFKNENESVSNLIARAQNELNFIAPLFVKGQLNKNWVDISHFGRGLLKDKFLLFDNELNQIESACKKENNDIEHLLGKSFCDQTPFKAANQFKINRKLSRLLKQYPHLVDIKHVLIAANELEKKRIKEAHQLMKAINSFFPKNPFIERKFKIYFVKTALRLTLEKIGILK